MYIPVIKENDPEKIPRSDEMVTQIVPVRSANAVQLLKDLTPLKASFSEMTANESGNALVITDTQANIRRMAEIVKAIDSSISGITSVKVFTLKFADAKDLATVIKELFPAQASSGSNRGGGGGFNPMAMMGRGGMRGGGGGGRRYWHRPKRSAKRGVQGDGGGRRANQLADRERAQGDR